MVIDDVQDSRLTGCSLFRPAIVSESSWCICKLAVVVGRGWCGARRCSLFRDGRIGHYSMDWGTIERLHTGVILDLYVSQSCRAADRWRGLGE